MEHSEPISVPNRIREEQNLEPGLQSSSPEADFSPSPSDLDYTAGIEEELRILDLKEAEERDLIEEEEVEIDDEEEEEEEEEEEVEVEDEDRESDETNQNTIEVQNETQSENENGKKMRKRFPYPVRPEAEDCAYYMKTGTCKFGSVCKFNHPVHRKNQAAKEKVNETEVLFQSQDQSQSQNQSHIECKYYLRTGGCKFGKACRYNHVRAKSIVASIVELNFLGLPIRSGAKECPYYMRNGSCKYGANCRFNHPDPTAVGVPDSPSVYDNGVSVSSQVAPQANLGSWSSPRDSNDPAPFAPVMYSPTRMVPSQNLEWSGYQAPLCPPERSVHSAPTYIMNNPVIDNVYTNHKLQVLVDEFPERPGQPECSYFLRTGDCKYKSNCKYHHPNNRISKSPPPCTLSDKGLPLRPDQNVCSHYSRYGICKFGPACKYDHPIHPPASSVEYGLVLPPSFSNSAARQESRMSGNGNGNGSDTEILQPV